MSFPSTRTQAQRMQACSSKRRPSAHPSKQVHTWKK
jgi:hypothetical protein